MYESLMMSTTSNLSAPMSQNQAIKWAFLGAHLSARFHRLVAKLFGQDYRLGELEQARHGKAIHSSREAGIQSVALKAIRGSEGRSQDFDRHFRPLQQHTRSRWENIARAMANGVPLPAVELVKTGESYYVRDGNHRISVGLRVSNIELTK